MTAMGFRRVIPAAPLKHRRAGPSGAKVVEFPPGNSGGPIEAMAARLRLGAPLRVSAG